MRQPNFLVILADQQSPHVLGYAGDGVVATPNLDRLAAQSVRFGATYCGSPLCAPSRMTMLAARQCSDLGLWSNSCVLDSQVPTFPGGLAAVGYETVLGGRMHFAGPDQRHGFTRRIIGDVDQARNKPAALPGAHPLLGNIPPETTGQSKEAVETAGPGRTAYQAYDDEVTSACRGFLKDWDQYSADKPFALVAGFVLPHCPFICPPDLFDYYYARVDVPQLPAGYHERLHPAVRAYRQRRGFDLLTDEQVRVARAAYYGMVEYHDRACGRLLETLRQTSFASNTIVVYLSDHGEMAGEHRLWTKSNFYEGAVGVPMLWSWPGHFQSESVPRVTSLLDVGPTMLDLAGAPPLPDATGRSLNGFLNGAPDPAWPDEAFSEYCGLEGDRPARALREGPWKIVHFHGFEEPQLFNLEEDPGELNDRRADPACAALRERLHARVREGWDGDRIEAAMANLDARRDEVFRRAASHALAQPDYWDVPPDTNIFPQSREGKQL